MCALHIRYIFFWLKFKTEYKLDNRTIRGPLSPINEYILIQKNDAYDTTEAGVFIGDAVRYEQEHK